MHSSRMRTTRLLAVSPSMQWEEGMSAPREGVSAPGRGSLVFQHALGQTTHPPREQNS